MHPTPNEVALILFVLGVIVTAIQAWRGWKLPGIILDSLLWSLVVVLGSLIAIYSYILMREVDNCLLLVLNPLAWLPLVLCRRHARVRRWIWIVYTVILVLFAVAVPLVSTGLSAPWRMLAATLAIRSLYHAFHACFLPLKR